MQRVDAVTLPTGEDNPATAITDGTYGYFNTDASPGQIVRVDLGYVPPAPPQPSTPPSPDPIGPAYTG